MDNIQYVCKVATKLACSSLPINPLTKGVSDSKLSFIISSFKLSIKLYLDLYLIVLSSCCQPLLFLFLKNLYESYIQRLVLL